jgi:hypothetical protein
MSDTGNDTAQANGAAPVFTEREMQMLAWAMQSLKSGAPEVGHPILPILPRLILMCTSDRLRQARWLRRHEQPALRFERLG